jgi:hypothetical protein
LTRASSLWLLRQLISTWWEWNQRSAGVCVRLCVGGGGGVHACVCARLLECVGVCGVCVCVCVRVCVCVVRACVFIVRVCVCAYV